MTPCMNSPFGSAKLWALLMAGMGTLSLGAVIASVAMLAGGSGAGTDGPQQHAARGRDASPTPREHAPESPPEAVQEARAQPPAQAEQQRPPPDPADRQARARLDAEARQFARSKVLVAISEWADVAERTRLAGGTFTWPMPNLGEGWRVAYVGMGRGEATAEGAKQSIAYPDSMGLTRKVLTLALEGGGLNIEWDPLETTFSRLTRCLQTVEWLELTYRTQDGERLTTLLLLNPLRREVALTRDLRGQVGLPTPLADLVRPHLAPVPIKDSGGFDAHLHTEAENGLLHVQVKYEYDEKAKRLLGQTEPGDAPPVGKPFREQMEALRNQANEWRAKADEAQLRADAAKRELEKKRQKLGVGDADPLPLYEQAQLRRHQRNVDAAEADIRTAETAAKETGTRLRKLSEFAAELRRRNYETHRGVFAQPVGIRANGTTVLTLSLKKGRN